MSQTSELPIGYSELRVLSCACALARREVSIKRQFFPKTAKPRAGFLGTDEKKKPRLELRVPRPHTSRRAAEGGEEAGDRVRWGGSGARTGR